MLHRDGSSLHVRVTQHSFRHPAGDLQRRGNKIGQLGTTPPSYCYPFASTHPVTRQDHRLDVFPALRPISLTPSLVQAIDWSDLVVQVALQDGQLPCKLFRVNIQQLVSFSRGSRKHWRRGIGQTGRGRSKDCFPFVLLQKEGTNRFSRVGHQGVQTHQLRKGTDPTVDSFNQLF
jgi:hypothetical protein